MNIQVNHDHYFEHSYDDKERFISYWNQINEVRKINPQQILEVGIGNGFLTNYLKGHGYNITTLDHNKNLKPDIISSIDEIGLKSNFFDLICCFEVLEHIPFEKFPIALEELYRVTAGFVLISIPDSTRVYQLLIELPRMKKIQLLIPKPFNRGIIHKFDGQHYWEIGKRGYPLNRIIAVIKKVGFSIKSSFRLFENPYHRFFVLLK